MASLGIPSPSCTFFFDGKFPEPAYKDILNLFSRASLMVSRRVSRTWVAWLLEELFEAQRLWMMCSLVRLIVYNSHAVI